MFALVLALVPAADEVRFTVVPAAGEPATGRLTALTADFTARVEGYPRTAASWICGEDLPQPGNRVTLSDELVDRWGLPAPEVHYDDHPNDVAMREHAYGRVEAMFRAVGAERVWRAPAMPSGHNLGTARMSADPADRQAALARSGLTRREYEVLRLAAQGRTNPEIARSTGLARNTVKTYLQAALHKLGARNRVEAIGKASEAGLL